MIRKCMPGSNPVVLKLGFENYPQCERKRVCVFEIVFCGHEVIHYQFYTELHSQLYHWKYLFFYVFVKDYLMLPKFVSNPFVLMQQSN